MTKYVRNTLTGSLAPVNNELEKIEVSLREKLDRNPSIGQNNEMLTDLDANSNRIINYPDAVDDSDLVTKGQVPSLAPVQTVDGQTGTVLSKVQSVNGQTGDVQIARDVQIDNGAVFDNISEMKSSSLELGQLVRCKRYYAGGDLVEDLCYLITVAESVDGHFNFTLANGLTAKLISNFDSINLAQGGAKYDGFFDCYPILIAAKGLVGTGEIIVEGREGDSVFLGYPNVAEILVGPLFNVSDGVQIKVSQPEGLTTIYGNSTIRVVRTTEFYEDVTDTYAYISPQTSSHVQDKNVWLDANDADLTLVSPINMSTELKPKSLDWDGSSDTFVTDVFSSASATSAQVNTGAGGLARLGMIKVFVGESVSGAFSAFNNTGTAVYLLIKCTSGYYGIYGSNTNSAITKFSKEVGSVRVETSANTEESVFSQYRLPVSNVTIKVNDLRHASICVNGVSYFEFDTLSDIEEVGIGAYDLGVGATILTMNDFVKITKAPTVSGVRALTVAVFGDSISAGSGVQHVYGSWPEQMKRILDGAAGVRVKRVRNYAVSGATSGTQLPLVTAPNLADSDIAIFMLGTNDIQGGVVLSTYLSNMQTMIDTAEAQGCKVIVGIPPMFYAQSDAATSTGNASGNATTNTASGAVYRSGLIRLCADSGVKVVDTLGGLGAISAKMLDKSLFLDSMVTDNIHPSVYGRLLLGAAYSKAILGALAPKNTTSVKGLLPASGLSGGALFTTEPVDFVLDSQNKEVSFRGVIDVLGGATDGTVIYTLPTNLRPTGSLRFVNFNGELGTSNLLIDANGSVVLYNGPVADTFVTFQVNYSLI